MNEPPEPEDEFSVHVTVAAGRAVVHVHGDIDLSTVDTFREQLADTVDSAKGDVIVDLSATTFCDVSGLNALLEQETRLMARGGHISLLHPCRSLIRALDAVDLHNRLPVECG